MKYVCPKCGETVSHFKEYSYLECETLDTLTGHRTGHIYQTATESTEGMGIKCNWCDWFVVGNEIPELFKLSKGGSKNGTFWRNQTSRGIE